MAEITVPIQSKPWQFQPGQSGNPLGKPKGTKHFETLFKDAVKKISNGEQEAPDIQIVRKVISKAKDGDLKAVELVMDKVDGKMIADPASTSTSFNYTIIQFNGDITNPIQLDAGETPATSTGE